MSTTLNLINISITSHSFHFLCVIRTVKIYSFHKLQVYNIVLLTTITVLYHISRMYWSCTTEPLYSLINTSPFHSLPGFWQPPFYSLLLCVWLLYGPHISNILQYLPLCVWFISCSIMSSRFSQVVIETRTDFFFKTI